MKKLTITLILLTLSITSYATVIEYTCNYVNDGGTFKLKIVNEDGVENIFMNDVSELENNKDETTKILNFKITDKLIHYEIDSNIKNHNSSYITTDIYRDTGKMRIKNTSHGDLVVKGREKDINYTQCKLTFFENKR